MPEDEGRRGPMPEGWSTSATAGRHGCDEASTERMPAVRPQGDRYSGPGLLKLRLPAGDRGIGCLEGPRLPVTFPFRGASIAVREFSERKERHENDDL